MFWCLIFNRFFNKDLYKIIQGITIRLRDLIDAVVSRRPVTLCVASGAAPGAAPEAGGTSFIHRVKRLLGMIGPDRRG